MLLHWVSLDGGDKDGNGGEGCIWLVLFEISNTCIFVSRNLKDKMTKILLAWLTSRENGMDNNPTIVKINNKMCNEM